MTKSCRYCSKEFVLESRHQVYCLGCKADAYRKKYREASKKYYATHPEFRVWKKKWSEEHYQTDEGRRYKTQWAKNHPDKSSGWRKRNPDKVIRMRHRYASVKGGYTGAFSYDLKEEVKMRDNYSCALCSESKKALVIHHKDKTRTNNDINNLITLCRACHMKIHGPN